MPSERPTIAVNGAGGFIGRNLVVRLREAGDEVLAITRETSPEDMAGQVGRADVVVHLAGAVRPSDPAEFERTAAYAEAVAEAIAKGAKRPLVICCSSIRADEDTPYGQSKRACEAAMLRLGEEGHAIAAVWRLPNVFGKWARPHYNSCIATFCHNTSRGLQIHIDDASAPLSLLYVDDLIDQWRAQMDSPPQASGFHEAEEVHRTTVGEAAALIQGFAADRASGGVAEVGQGLERALYATFVAALPPKSFCYPLQAHTDARGSFTEMLKTRTSGQVSFLTAHPGVTRGGHYHHSKVEKFLVVQGQALFRFRHILSGETWEVQASGSDPMVVETIPGWTHDITNVGNEVMISLLWASELFDRERPDTVMLPV